MADVINVFSALFKPFNFYPLACVECYKNVLNTAISRDFNGFATRTFGFRRHLDYQARAMK